MLWELATEARFCASRAQVQEWAPAAPCHLHRPSVNPEIFTSGSDTARARVQRQSEARWWTLASRREARSAEPPRVTFTRSLRSTTERRQRCTLLANAFRSEASASNSFMVPSLRLLQQARSVHQPSQLRPLARIKGHQAKFLKKAHRTLRLSKEQVVAATEVASLKDDRPAAVLQGAAMKRAIDKVLAIKNNCIVLEYPVLEDVQGGSP